MDSSRSIRAFISSSLEELAGERNIIRESLQELRISTWLFEKDAGAQPENIEKVFLNELENCDLYIGLFWRKLGNSTIDEYEYARKLGISCLIYEKRLDIQGKRSKELQDFLDQLNNISTGLTLRRFRNVNELADFIKKDVASWQASVIKKENQLIANYNNLPPEPYKEFIGRSNELNLLHRILTNPSESPMLAIYGLGGMGKTALARKVVQLLQNEHCFDSIVWVNAKSEEFLGHSVEKSHKSATTFKEVLSEIAKQLNHPNLLRANEKEQIEAISSILNQRQILLVIDNLETIEQYEQLVIRLFSILGRSRILFTSRHKMVHDKLFELKIEGMSENDGILFIRSVANERNIEAVEKANLSSLRKVYKATGGAPLAMRLVIGQVSQYTLNAVIENLQSVVRDHSTYEFYQFLYKFSWSLLTIDGKRLLVAMASFPPIKGGTEDAIKNVSELSSSIFANCMSDLVRMSLVDKSGTIGYERFALHPLTKYFVLSDIVKYWDSK